MILIKLYGHHHHLAWYHIKIFTPESKNFFTLNEISSRVSTQSEENQDILQGSFFPSFGSLSKVYLYMVLTIFEGRILIGMLFDFY